MGRQCYQPAAIEVSQSTGCKTFHVTIVMDAPDQVVSGRTEWIRVKGEWRKPGVDIKTKLMVTSPTGGKLVFNGADGPDHVNYSGNFEAQLALFGKAASPMGADGKPKADVKLGMYFDDEDEPKHSIQLAVIADPANETSVRAKLEKEMIAACAETSATSSDAKIWKRYDSIITDAQNIAAALATKTPPASAEIYKINGKVESRNFDHSALQKHLASGRTGLAPTKSKGKKDAFDAFEGKWRGHWYAGWGCATPKQAVCQDHQWDKTVVKGDLALQPVVMGSDSRSLGIEGKSCLDLEPDATKPFRDRDNFGINAINFKTGVILGSVDLRTAADDDGVWGARPHVGFWVDKNTLIWVAEESREKDTSYYSVFWEKGENGPGNVPVYTIIGFQFSWHRANKAFVGGFTAMGGQYRKALTTAQLDLYRDFRDKKISVGHLQDPGYLKELESMSPTEAAELKPKEENAAISDYLERLKTFLASKKAWDDAGVHPRQDVLFIMGEQETGSTSKRFYRSATAHYTLNPEGTLVVDKRNLEEVLDYLAFQLSGGNRWGKITIVSHATEEGMLAVPVTAVPAGEQKELYTASVENLKKAIAAKSPSPAKDTQVDVRTSIYIRGCAAGRQANFPKLISQFFGGDDAQRPAAYASKHLQWYEYVPSTWSHGSANPPNSTDAYFIEIFLVGYPGNKLPKSTTMIADLKAAYPSININWSDALKKNRAPSGDEVTYETRNRNKVKQISHNYYDLPTTDAKLTAFIKKAGYTLDGSPENHFKDGTDFKLEPQVVLADGRIEQKFTYKKDGGDWHWTITTPKPPPKTQKEVDDFVAANSGIIDEIGRVGLTVADYTWSASYKKIKTDKQRHFGTLTITGKRIILRVERELRVPDPNNPGKTMRFDPPLTDSAHYNSEIPAQAPTKPLGENVDPNL